MIVPQEILAQHTAVLGKTGSGKTSTAKLLIEQVVADGARVCVLDPIKSDWWGLTSSADGKRAGLPFHILGGPRGHVPLHASAGKAIGEIVASGALPLSIIDMTDFEPGGQAKFFTEFAPTLLRKMRGVVYLVIEEAHLFAPKERSGIGAENLSIHWAKTLATAGRSKGVRLILVTQRTQALHNALLGSCDTMIAHRLTAPADQAPVVKWLKANTTKEILEKVSSSLASLKTGSAWLCSGEAKRFEVVQFPRIHTYDNTATPTGDGETRDIKTAPVDQEKLRAIIGDAVDQAKADDPRELRKTIDGLRKQLALKSSAPVEKVSAPVRVEVPIVLDKDLARAEKLFERAESLILAFAEADRKRVDLISQQILAVVVDVRNTRDIIRAAIAPAAVAAQGREVVASVRPPKPRPAGSTPATVASSGAGDPAVGKAGLRRMLIALAQRSNGLTRGQLGVRARVSAKGGSFDTYLSRARTAGWVDTGGERIVITDAGLAALGRYEPLPEGQALLEHYIREFGASGAARMLRALADVYPAALTRAELSNASGVSAAGGSFDTYLSRLRTLELIEGKTELRASEELF